MGNVIPSRAVEDSRPISSAPINQLRLCPIYVRDLLRLIERPQIERCRGVSHYYNRVISTTAEVHLPRRCLKAYITSVGPHFISRYKNIPLISRHIRPIGDTCPNRSQSYV
jgi:hypothetical protein